MLYVESISDLVIESFEKQCVGLFFDSFIREFSADFCFQY